MATKRTTQKSLNNIIAEMVTIQNETTKTTQKTLNNKAEGKKPIDLLKDFIKDKSISTGYFPVKHYNHNDILLYIPNICAVIPDINQYNFGGFKLNTLPAKVKEKFLKLDYAGFNDFDLITRDELKHIEKYFAEFIKISCYIYHTIYVYSSNKTSVNYITYQNNSFEYKSHSVLSTKKQNDVSLIPVHRLMPANKYNFRPYDVDSQALEFIREGLIPTELDKTVQTQLIELHKSGISETESKSDNIKEQPANTAKDKADKVNLNLTDKEKELIECDYKRFNFIKYEKERLIDPMLGHWDIWNSDESNGSDLYKTKDGFTARNPKLDVHREFTVAIDFGTNSTVVAVQGNSEIKTPLRIGTSDFSSSAESRHFENPTFMQFINLKEFMENFNSKNGRPDTKFNDVTVSVNAKNSMLENIGVLDKFYTFFYDLKQWADGQKKSPVIFDSKGYSEQLKPFIQIQDDDFNPIVLYAYYIGLHINNMNRGICLDYLLSYPVTYEKNVCEKIRHSFEIGLKKSLPSEILEDESIMKYFRVSLTASEPASYAVCALQQFNIEPENEDKILYGVFDFGGGTADYDYGIYEEEPDDDRYDYRLTRFQSVGDRYLGGENILERMAYNVYISNYQEMSKKQIPFVKPANINSVTANEILLSDTPTVSAKMNLFVLKERLRPFWEGINDYDTEKNKEISDISFNNINGQCVNDINLKVDFDRLREYVHEEISRGINNFFNGLTNAVSHLPEGYQISDFKKIYIILAGNSSRSPIVKEEFDKCIKTFCEKKGVPDAADTMYEILPPLGTAEADKMIFNENIPEDKIYYPNCKTGVAFGLLDCRLGGNIKFVNEVIGKSDSNIKFKYYVGRKKKKKLVPVITPNNAYNQWYPVVSAELEDFELYFTESPAESNGSWPVSSARHIRCRLDETDSDKMVYIRAVNSDTIEYVSATENMLSDELHGISVKLE